MISITEKTHTLTCKVLEPKHISAVTQCISSTFIKGEPMSEALNIREEEFSYFAQLFIQKAATDQLSVVAVTDTGEIAGALICEDYATDPPMGLDQVSEKFNPIFCFFFFSFRFQLKKLKKNIFFFINLFFPFLFFLGNICFLNLFFFFF